MHNKSMVYISFKKDQCIRKRLLYAELPGPAKKKKFSYSFK